MADTMETFVDKLRRQRDAMMTTVLNEMEAQAVNGPKPSYSLDGQGVSWDQWLSGMNAEIVKISETIARLSWWAGPVHSRWSS